MKAFNRAFTFAALAALLAFFFCGCSAGQAKTQAAEGANNHSRLLPPPLTNPLNRTVLGYGVAANSFTPLVAEPGAETKGSSGYIRQGDIVEVTERRNLGDKGIWLKVRKNGGASSGWVPEKYMEVYDNKTQAETAARQSKMGDAE
jgi:hypothetical protein